jgi:hypothetical protein
MTRIVSLLIVASSGAAWYLALPPRAPAASVAAAESPRALRGAIHVHTSRSDGTGTMDDVAAAAARAGLDFVIVTDHGDGTREPSPPQYRGGVLVVDAVEISTRDGHVLALGLPQAPYPLGGEARDVVEDVARLGGFTIAAHPVSGKPELDWRDWTVPVDGVEWLNGDSEWRDESAWTLARALLTYPARRVETLASLLDRPVEALRQWDRLTPQRPVVALAGADAHARIGLRHLGEPYDSGISLHVPAYDRLFDLFSNVIPDLALGGDPVADARAVLAAIRAGRLYSRVDVLGHAPFMFTRSTDKTTTVLHVDVQGAPDARVDLWKDGVVVASAAASGFEHTTDGPGVYRVEVSRSGAPGNPPIPWIVSNPMYVGRQPAARPAARAPRPASAVMPRYSDGPATGWTIEASVASAAAVDVVKGSRGTELALRYAIGGAASSGPFAAFAFTPGPDLARADRLVFTARADRPMRLSVQLREPAGEAGYRWQRSVHLTTEPRDVTVYFDDLRPAGETPRDLPVLASVDSVLLVVDTTNMPLGGSGRIWIDDVRYAR